MRERMRALPRAAALAGLLVAFGGCASQIEKAELDLDELVALLPGTYDNVAQATAADAPGPRQPALALVIFPVHAPAIGKHVYYVQETAADDSQRVLAQRLYSFEVDPKGGLVQSVLVFEEPQRWRGGGTNPDLLKGLMTQDVRPIAGCELTWRRAGQGFEGSNDRLRCRSNVRGGQPLQVETRAELDAEGFALSDRHFDAAGRVVYGNFADPFYRFERRGN